MTIPGTYCFRSNTGNSTPVALAQTASFILVAQRFGQRRSKTGEALPI
ncbi:MAG: hypothetical protein OJF50_002320 [Nitrospira sp.]|nr:hypothetical protein [Nitrospira sp.]